MWACKIWINGQRCGQPAAVIDADRGCAVCAAHRRGPQQPMACCQCQRLIAAGERWEWWNATDRRRDGTDRVSCGACMAQLLRAVKTQLAAVPLEQRGDP